MRNTCLEGMEGSSHYERTGKETGASPLVSSLFAHISVIDIADLQCNVVSSV